MKAAREILLASVTEKMGTVAKGIFTANQFPIGETSVSGQHVRIIFYLARKQEGVSVKELAERLNVTSGAVSQFIDVLVEKGLVRREEDPDDRRLLRMKLTRTANNSFPEFRKGYFATVSRAFNSLSDEEINKLLELLNKIAV